MIRADWWCLLLIAVLGLGVGLSGTTNLPLDVHEVYVAQTAQHLLDSPDGLARRLDDSRHLQKPPLSYWAVAMVAGLSGHEHVSELDTRWPSIIAGVLLALLVFATARAESGRAVGLLAGLITVSCLGFFRYGHSARPDMLSGLLAFAMLAAYIWATRLKGRQQLSAALVIWLALGLHVLANGPRFGVVVLLAIVLHAAATAPAWRQVWRRLRPELGVPLLALITLAWWLPLQHAIAPQLAESQRSGLSLSVPLGRLLQGSCWWHAPAQWAPWLVLIVPAWRLSWRQRGQTAGLLLLALLWLIVVFSLGSQYCDIYMAPTVGFAGLWLALGAATLCLSPSRWAWAGWAVQGLLLAIIVVGGLVWVGLHSPALSITSVLAMIVSAGLVLATLERLRHIKSQPYIVRWQVLVLLGSALSVALMAAATLPSIWNGTRFYQYQLTQDMQPYRERAIAILAPQPPEVFVYYLQRPVSVVVDVDALCRWAAAQPGNTQPLVLYHPVQSVSVSHAVPGLTPLLQSPGSRYSSVIVAEVGTRPGCMAAGQAH